MKFSESNRIYKEMDEKGIRINSERLDFYINGKTQEFLSELNHSGFKTVAQVKASLTAQLEALPKVILTEGGKVATSAQALEGSSARYAKLYLKVSSLQREISSLKGIKSKLGKDFRIHPEHRITSEGGRVYVAEFNYTNLSKSLRDLVQPDEEQNLWEIDFTCAEYVVLGVLSNDLVLQKACQEGDPHVEVAAEIFHVNRDEVTSEQRKVGKLINFAIVYGATEYFIAQELDVSVELGREYRNSFKRVFPRAHKFIEDLTNEAQGSYVASTVFGSEKDMTGRKRPERSCVSHKIQGTMGEVTRLCIMKVSEATKQLGGRVVGSLFDSYLISLPKRVAELQVLDLKRVVEDQAKNLGFPLGMKTHFHGDCWIAE